MPLQISKMLVDAYMFYGVTHSFETYFNRFLKYHIRNNITFDFIFVPQPTNIPMEMKDNS